MISFVGIIGKQQKPLYLKTFSDEANHDEARLIELAYSASDVFQERIQAGHRIPDLYFGLLTALPDVVLYGYMSNTRIKFILAIQETDLIISESMVKSMLTRIHREYTKAGRTVVASP